MRRVRCYATFKDMIEDVGITDLLPDFKGSLQDAVDLYHSFGNQRGSVSKLSSNPALLHSHHPKC